MVTTDEPTRVAAFWFVYERITAMLADVKERFDAVVLLSHHQDFFPPDGLHLPVPGLRKFRLPAQQ